MLTQEMNIFLTRTGPGTPMGELFRRYWIPALLDWELSERDCPPVRVELLGVIWTYMGPPEEKPPLPNFEWVHLPPSHRVTTKRWQESNYLQAIEGGIDSSHVSFLHRGDLAADPFHRNTAGAKFAKSTKTTFHILDSAGGLIIGARRDADPGNYYWRITQWIMPWYTLIPPYAGNALNGHAWVPMDDENCMAWSMTFHPAHPIPKEH